MGGKPDKKQKRIEDGVENHGPDQIRANAHELLDRADAFCLISLNKDETIGRLLQADEKDTLAIIGAMEYQIHRLKLWMDSLKIESGDGDEEDPTPV